MVKILYGFNIGTIVFGILAWAVISPVSAGIAVLGCVVVASAWRAQWK